MLITHNMMAMNAQRQFNIVGNSKKRSMEKLSSGYRINRAADDAAGLSISEKMRWQIRGLNKGSDNVQDGISLCQVADGALAEVDDMLHRITELSVQAANDTNTDEDRQAIQKEISEILSEIDRIGSDTEFNKRFVFKGNDSINEATADVNNVNPTPSELSTKERYLKIQVSGTAIDTTPDVNIIKADVDNGIQIGTDIFSWNSFKTNRGVPLDKDAIIAGTYSLSYNGMNISISVTDGQTIDNIAEQLNDKSINVSTRVVSQQASISHIVSVDSKELVTVSDVNLRNETKPSYKIHADEDGIWIDNHKKVTWSSINLDLDNPMAGKYRFKDPDSNIGFEFEVLDGAKKEGIIKAWDDVQINTYAIKYGAKSANATIQNMAASTKLLPFDGTNINVKYTAYLNKFDGNILSAGAYGAILKYGMSSDNRLMLEYYEQSSTNPLGKRNASKDFYITPESLGYLKYRANYSESLSMNDVPDNAEKITFRNSDGNEVYLYLKSSGGSFSQLSELFEKGDGGVIFTEGKKVDVTYRAASISPNSYENGNVGKVISEKYIKDDDKTLVDFKDTYEVKENSPATPITPTQPNGQIGGSEKKSLNLWIQSGAQANQGMFLEIDNMNTTILGLDGIDVSTSAGAGNAITAAHNALDQVNANRSKIGAQQNRLEHTMRNNDNTSENTQDAESKIRDTDMAMEMVEFSKQSILEQVGQSMMAQSNKSVESVLALLQG